MIVVLMGVSGSGKSTVGRVLAERLGWPFHDADDSHTDANKAKMREGIPLDDEDREPWLRELARMIDEACEDDRDLVLACSALKRSYRDHLRTDRDCVRFVFLQGSLALIERRLNERDGHFMDPDLLASQIEALEIPERAVAVDITPPPEVIAEEIRHQLGSP